MGAYFGLKNTTTNECVAGYWKNSPPSKTEIIIFAHILGWSKGDNIFTASYSSGFVWDWTTMSWSGDLSTNGNKSKPPISDTNNSGRKEPYDAYELYCLYDENLDLDNMVITRCKQFEMNSVRTHCKNCDVKVADKSNLKLGSEVYYFN